MSRRLGSNVKTPLPPSDPRALVDDSAITRGLYTRAVLLIVLEYTFVAVAALFAPVLPSTISVSSYVLALQSYKIFDIHDISGRYSKRPLSFKTYQVRVAVMPAVLPSAVNDVV